MHNLELVKTLLLTHLVFVCQRLIYYESKHFVSDLLLTTVNKNSFAEFSQLIHLEFLEGSTNFYEISHPYLGSFEIFMMELLSAGLLSLYDCHF